jgi:hypothetical protein
MGIYKTANGMEFEIDSEFMDTLPKDKQEYMFDVYDRRSRGEDTSIDVEAQRPSREQLDDLAWRDRPGHIVGVSDAALQGITAGTFDEAQAFGTSLFNGKSYDENHDDLKARRDAYSQENPYIAGGVEVGGAMLGFGKANAALLAKTAGMSRFKRGAAALGAGVAEGALYGAASGDGVGNRIDTAVDGAMFGAAGAAAAKPIEVVLQGLGGVGILAKRKLFDTPRDELERALAVAARADGIDADEAIKMLDDMGPESTLMDLGDNLRALAADLKRKVGSAKGVLTDFLDERQKGVRAGNGIDRVNSQQTRLLDAAEESAGTSGADLKRSTEEVQREMREKAGPLYDVAYDTPFVMTPVMQDLLDKPAVKTAYDEALVTVKNNIDAPKNSPIERLDHTIRNLFDQETASKVGANESRQIRLLRQELTRQVNEASPELAEARAIWAAGAGVDNAGKTGRGLLTQNPEDLREAAGGMNQAELDMFRRGGMNAVNDSVDRVKTGMDAGGRLSGTQRSREQLGVLFDDIDPFIKQLDAEEEFTRTRRAVTGGSVTNEATQGQQAFGGAAALDAAVLMQTGVGAVGNAQNAMKILEKNGQMSDEAVTELAQHLVNKGITPDEVRKLLNSKALKSVTESYFPVFSKALKDGIKGATTGGVLAITSD